MAPDSNLEGYRRYCVVFALTVIVLFGATWWWLIEEPMAYNSLAYGIWQAKLEMIKDNQFGRVTVLGDSRPVAAMIPSRIGPGVVNLALPGASPIDIYYLSERILSRPVRPQAVILSITPTLLVEARFFWERSVGYDFLTPQQLQEVRLRSRALHDTTLFVAESPYDIDARLTSFLYEIKFPPYFFSSLWRAGFFRRYQSNVEAKRAVLSSRGQEYFGTDHGTTGFDLEASLHSFAPTKILDNYFDSTLALYQSQNIPVYFVSVPHSDISERVYFPGLKQAYTSYLNHYSLRYPIFHILGDPFPAYPSDCFGDGPHLNEKGAIRWSNYVAQLLTQSHVEGGPFGPN
jgi:hypothetical protein